MTSKFTQLEEALAKASGGKLIAAKTFEDRVVIVVEDGRKLTFTPDQVEAVMAKAESDAKAKAKAEAKAKREAEKAEAEAKEEAKRAAAEEKSKPKGDT